MVYEKFKMGELNGLLQLGMTSVLVSIGIDPKWKKIKLIDIGFWIFLD